MKSQYEGNGLLHITIKEVASLSQQFQGPSKLNLRVGDQGYISTFNLAKASHTLDDVRMFECNSEDICQLEFTNDKSGSQGELRFPLRQLTEMPRVKHVIEAMLIKKVEKEKHSNPQSKIENMIKVNLEVIYLNRNQGKFTLESIEVQLTRNTEMIGQMDPYILISLDGQQYSTKAKKNQGRHCIWTERIELIISRAGNSILSFRIYDQDPIKDDLICLGEVFLLKEGMLIPSEKAKQRQFQLLYEGQIAGSIKLEYRFELLPFNF